MPDIQISWYSYGEDIFDNPSRSQGIPLLKQYDPEDSPLYRNAGVFQLMQVDILASIEAGILPGRCPKFKAAPVKHILFTCKQIYNEALEIFWSQNSFIFRCDEAVEIFFHRLGYEQRSLVRSIGIQSNGGWHGWNEGPYAWRQTWMQDDPLSWSMVEHVHLTCSPVVRHVWFTKKPSSENHEVELSCKKLLEYRPEPALIVHGTFPLPLEFWPYFGQSNSTQEEILRTLRRRQIQDGKET